MVNNLLDSLEKLKDEKSAMNVGIALLISDITIEEKKNLFEKAFKMELPDDKIKQSSIYGP